MRCSLAGLLLVLAAPSLASAQAAGMRVYQIDGVRVDGALGDWRQAEMTQVGRGRDASMRFAVGNDGEGLFVAAEVTDDRLVRTPQPGNREDAVVLTLAIGQGRRRSVVDIYLFAGVSGRSAATAGLARSFGGRPRPLRGARVVEAPRRGGYTLEAYIPFRSIPNGQRWESARASIRLRDVDSEAHPEVESEPSLVDVDAQHLDNLVPLMPTGGASGALNAFLNERGIAAARPTHTLNGDVRGDGQPERVYLVHNYVLVTGPGVRGGGYAFHQLSVDHARDVRSARLRDLTGDGKAELVVVLRQRNDQGERDLWQVIDLHSERIREMFAIEVRKAIRGGGSVEARVRILNARGRQAPEIEVSSHRAQRLDRESYREAPATDVVAMLLPWGRIRSRRFRWNGRTFAQTSERENPRYEPPQQASPATRPSTATRPSQSEPATPSPPSEERLLGEFRRQRGIGRRARPRFRMRANVAGDRGQETVQVFGRHLVAVGSGIQNGGSWFYYEIPAPSDQDLLDVSSADVTGDRRHELIFRVRQSFGEVTREVLIVHQFTPRGFPRLLVVEVARHQGDQRIENQVQTRGGRLTIRPGRAVGWNEQSYRFERGANDSAEPLLLPWSDRAVTYRLRGGRLQR